MTIWKKTITLGKHKNSEAYCKALKENDFQTGNLTNQILDKVKISQNEIDIDLVILSVAELGFSGKHDTMKYVTELAHLASSSAQQKLVQLYAYNTKILTLK